MLSGLRKQPSLIPREPVPGLGRRQSKLITAERLEHATENPELRPEKRSGRFDNPEKEFGGESGGQTWSVPLLSVE